MNTRETNPNWTCAPFEFSFLFATSGPRWEWSRKRRLKWIRRRRKEIRREQEAAHLVAETLGKTLQGRILMSAFGEIQNSLFR